MLLTLNLLSPTKKTKLQDLVVLLFVKHLLGLIIITVAGIAAALLWGWWMLVGEYGTLAESVLLVNHDYSSFNSEVKYINNTVKEVELASKDFSPITPVLAAVFSALPPGIKVRALDFEKTSRRLTLTGTARTRTDILALEGLLKKVPGVARVEVPLTDLFQKEDVLYEVRLYLVQ